MKVEIHHLVGFPEKATSYAYASCFREMLRKPFHYFRQGGQWFRFEKSTGVLRGVRFHAQTEAR